MDLQLRAGRLPQALWGLALILLGLGASSLAAADRGDALESARQTGSARLQVLWVASSGWAERDAAGQPGGLSIELMRRFARWLQDDQALAVELEWVEEVDWSRFYRRVRDGSGGLFGLGNVTITETRRAELQFSPPYARNTGVLISPAAVAEIESPQALAQALSGLTALAFADTLHEQRLQALARADWPAMPIERSRSNDEILAAVAAGSHFAYIDGYHYLRAVADGAPLRRHPAFDAADERFGIIMPLDNDWSGLLAQFLVSADGGFLGTAEYRRLFEQHLGEDIARLMRLQPED